VAYLCLVDRGDFKDRERFMNILSLWHFTGYNSDFMSLGLTFKNSNVCLHHVFVCFVCISEQTAAISTHSIKPMDGVTVSVFTARFGLKCITIKITFRV
jgi:hypothetical protein